MNGVEDIEPAVPEARDNAAPHDEEKKEAVKQTINEIKSEHAPAAKSRRARDVVFKIFAVLFFPVTLAVLGGRKALKKLRLGITAKTTVVFTLVFGLMLIGYVVFILVSIDNLVGSPDGVTRGYMNRLITTSAILVAVFIVLGAVLGGFSSRYMIEPVRKITKRVEEITDNNDLSARVETYDSQDEIMELTNRINDMLTSLEEAFERQENFVSDASHELKTPLSVIAGYANLLRRWGKDDPKILDESVEAISRESENMKRIVEQLLWLAKIGRFTVNNSLFNLYETVSDIVDGYKMVNTKHTITLTGDALVTLNADKNLLTEAVRTLVDNAIKYTPPVNGVIKINIEQVEGHVEISITDNGIGISEKDQAHIFERFYRCDKVRGRESGSSGLGLTICKSIIEMMGGKILFTSAIGEGSTFRIELY